METIYNPIFDLFMGNSTFIGEKFFLSGCIFIFCDSVWDAGNPTGAA